MPNKPIEPEWQRLDNSRGSCMYCRSPLRLGETGFTCDRCAILQQKLSMASYELTDDELHELEEYSRFIHTVSLEAEKRELQELGHRLNATGSFKS